MIPFSLFSAAIIELSYRPEGPAYSAEILFRSEQSWMDDIDTTLDFANKILVKFARLNCFEWLKFTRNQEIY